jgi:hypothetical protein
MAVVDRNFTGWMREIFADAGKYVLHFAQGLNQPPTETYIPPPSASAPRNPFLPTARAPSGTLPPATPSASDEAKQAMQAAEAQHKLQLLEVKMQEKVAEEKQKALTVHAHLTHT